ncbi:MAG: M48 family metalloprotease [Actinobacteria bacterium]|nr:M48 family metalloprotease [Actinomycetota bacterium]
MEILTHYIIPVLYDSFVTLVLVLAIFFIFRIKDSGIRILFLFMPLIRPFIIVLEKVNIEESIYNYESFPKSLGALGIRLPDPTNMVTMDIDPIILASNTNYIILQVIIFIIFIVLLIRWINLALFYRRLAYEEKVGRKEVPAIYNIIDNYIEKIKTRSPDVSLTHNNYISPFVVGVRNFTLVLSPGLLEKLDESEKETLIWHELSHIKRRDGLIGWIALILRDLNFFNPFGYFAYFLIRSEQEKACDKMVVKYSGLSPKKIARNILNSLLKLKCMIGPNSRLVPCEGYTFSPAKVISQKRLEDRVNSIIRTNPGKINMGIFPKILMYILFVFMVLIQIMFVIRIGNFFILLR